MVNLPLAGFLMLALSITGCNQNDKDDPTTRQPLITAIIISGGNPVEITTFGVTVMDPANSGQPILDAVVKVNALNLAGTGDGTYTYVDTDTPIAAGGIVALSVNVDGEDYGVSSVMPEDGHDSYLEIPSAYAGSSLHIANNP